MYSQFCRRLFASSNIHQIGIERNDRLRGDGGIVRGDQFKDTVSTVCCHDEIAVANESARENYALSLHDGLADGNGSAEIVALQYLIASNQRVGGE